MKQWRKQAKKEFTGEYDSITDINTGKVLAKIPVMKRNGRELAQEARMTDMLGKQMIKTYPLLDALFKQAGMTYALSKKQQETLKQMIESQKEQTQDETK